MILTRQAIYLNSKIERFVLIHSISPLPLLEIVTVLVQVVLKKEKFVFIRSFFSLHDQVQL